MRVLQINAVYAAGSTGTIVRDLAELSLRKGIETSVAYGTSPLQINDIPNGFQVGNIFDHKIHAILCRANGKQAYYSKNATKKLFHHIDKFAPDIIHLHNLHSNFINLNLLLCYIAEKRIKTIITLHDCWFYTGGCFHYTNAGCYKWLDQCGQCPKKNMDTPACFRDCSAAILKDRKTYFSSIPDLTVVGVSEWITEEAKKTFFRSRNCVTIHNGINTEFYKPTQSNIREELGIGDESIFLGMANKWLNPVNKDGLEFFSKNCKKNSVMVIAGCSNISETKRDGSIILLPYFHDPERLRQLYSMADVFVNCTREESLSLVNIEAQACGTPVVTYNNTGVSETVDGLCGFRVKTGDYKELFERARDAISIKRSGSGFKCTDFVMTKYDRNKNYEKYIDLYMNKEQEEISEYLQSQNI